MPVKVYAEIGSSPAPFWNFNRWCQVAQWIGADGIKAQLWRAEHFGASEAMQKRPFEFPRSSLGVFTACAHSYGLTSGVSVFDDDAAQQAALVCDWLKLAAREADNHDLFLSVYAKAAMQYRQLYRSISDLSEYSLLSGVVNLYTIQSYPASMALSLWRVLQAAHFFRRRGREWGWSSHTRGALDSVWAAYLGASVVEKHLCLTTKDVEAGHSLLPAQFRKMVSAIHKNERTP